MKPNKRRKKSKPLVTIEKWLENLSDEDRQKTIDV